MTCALLVEHAAEDPGEGHRRPRRRSRCSTRPDRSSGYRMTVRAGGTKRRVKVDGAKTPTYTYQLEAFAAAVLRRRAGAHAAGGLGREHARHRRDLRGGRPSGPGDVMEHEQLGAYLARGRVGLGLAAMVAPGPTLGAGRSAAARTTRRACGRPAARRARLGARRGRLDRDRSARRRRRLAVDDGAVSTRSTRVVMLATPGLPEAGPAHRARAPRSRRSLHLYLAREIAAAEEPATTPIRSDRVRPMTRRAGHRRARRPAAPTCVEHGLAARARRRRARRRAGGTTRGSRPCAATAASGPATRSTRCRRSVRPRRPRARRVPPKRR